jgi:hypothetical protein
MRGFDSRPRLEKMKEKIYELPIQRPLIAARRKAIEQFLEKHSSKLKWPCSYRWDEKNGQLLHIIVFPVKWEIWFAPTRITVFGSGPVWTRILFTKKKRAMLREGILHVLKETGF